MKRPFNTKIILGFLVVAGCAVLAVAGHISAQTSPPPMNGATLRASLSGGEEVQPVSTSSTGSFQMDARGNYTLAVSANNVTAAHLHCGARGENGPAIVMLFASTNGEDFTNREMSGTISTEDFLAPAMNCSPNVTTMAHLMQAVREGKIYANVHTVEHPNGEIRGQVMVDGSMRMPTRPAPGGSTTIVESRDMRIYEMGTSDAGSRTFMITINNNLLAELEGLLRHLFGILDNQQFRFSDQTMDNYNLNRMYGNSRVSR